MLNCITGVHGIPVPPISKPSSVDYLVVAGGGGGWGANGGNSANGTLGGLGGYAIKLNGNSITWTAHGTEYGSVA